ncbi:MAG: hypothetical protein WCX82_03780 [archaeon]|jgi:hypothetical protein
MTQSLVGGILLGIGIGLYIPALPGVFSIINNYIGLILIVIGLILLLKSKN